MAVVVAIIVTLVVLLVVLLAVVLPLSFATCRTSQRVEKEHRTFSKRHQKIQDEHHQRLVELSHACNDHEQRFQQRRPPPSQYGHSRITADVEPDHGKQTETQTQESVLHELQSLREDLNQLLAYIRDREPIPDNDEDEEEER